MRPLTGIAILLLVSGVALAQRGAGNFAPTPRPQGPMHGHHFSEPVFLGGGWYPGYVGDVVQQTPQVIVIQTPAAAPVVKEEPKPIIPLMIELQDGRYVRSDQTSKPSTEAKALLRGKNVAGPARAVPAQIVAAVLVFRDGHREQVREYTVADGAIYAHGDYWVDGYWNKKILLSALDVRATLSVNQGSGANFELPSAPNVVVVRP
jgi:hypothetical protein